MSTLYTFWGKTPKSAKSISAGIPYHPAICHMLDVAVTAQALLESAGLPLRRLLLEPLVGDETHKIAWLAFMVALHDLGKVSPGFQRKVPALCSGEAYPLSTDPQEDEADHGKVTYVTLTPLLAEKTGGEREIAKILAHTVGAHHGRFYSGLNLKKLKPTAGKGRWPEAREAVAEALREVLELNWTDFPFHEAMLTPAFILGLAGLTAVADWLGSDEGRFGYVGAFDGTLAEYKNRRLEIARQIVESLHWGSATLAAEAPHFAQLFKFNPNRCQQTALDIARDLQGPALLLIETPMGSGKTEAALAVADWWMRGRQAQGIYYALPTQATANQMFGRLRSFLQHYAQQSDIEFHLLHAYAALHEGYQALQATAVYDPAEKRDDRDDAAVQASAWFSGPKRGLLSAFAVGTVDQALLAAMRAKHMFVRLFGLTGKVVIIDEVHAYDAYTSELLNCLLSWLAQLGASVILLSATLPPAKRQALLGAYQPKALLEAPPHYPCIIGADQQGRVLSRTLAWPEAEARAFTLQLLCAGGDERWDKVRGVLADTLQSGGCAACIVNTVMEAQALFKVLENDPLFSDTLLILFHARFPMGQRLHIEKQLENLFGKPEKTACNRPDKAIVVATQVLEQSLDVDFDVMISELAPIDLLLQRAGRLWRHLRDRPEKILQAVLYCLQADLSGVKPEFGGTGKIYAPAVLLKTALVLKSLAGKEILLPGSVQDSNGVENLISQVYEADKSPPCPARLQDLLEDEQWKNNWGAKQERAAALEKLLPEPCDSALDFFDALENDYASDDDNRLEALTRLAPPSVTLIVLHEVGSQYCLHAEGAEPVKLKGSEAVTRKTAKKLLHNAVRISNPDWVKHFQATRIPSRWEESPLLRRCYPAVFRNGELRAEPGVLRISRAYGLEVEWSV